MELTEVVSWVSSIGLAIGLAAVAGLRAWLPLLLAGLLARFDVIQLGESFDVLSSTPALVAFGVATVVEIVADKVPALDHGLDLISTFVRPAAGTVLAASALFEVKHPLIALGCGVIIGAPVALAPHIVKAKTRAASTIVTGGVANPVLSVGEDFAAIGLFLVTIVLPMFAVIFVAAMLFVMWRRRSKQAAAKTTSPPEAA